MNITDMIERCKKRNGQVYIFSDLHLLKRGKDTPRITERSDVMHAFDLACTQILEDDMVIFLGDLVDDTIPKELAEKQLRLFMYGTNYYVKDKIFIRGNNDMYADDMIRKCGFIPCYSATARINSMGKEYNLIFSHTSLECPTGYYNIHGHMHNNGEQMYYYHNPKGCVNIAPHCNKGGYKTLNDCIKLIKSSVWTDYKFYPGEEKPGMSRFIKEMATYEAINDRKENV